MMKKALLLVAAAFLVSCDSGEEKPGAHRPDILLISVDALRADHLELYGYERNTAPRINEWFGKGTVFEKAYSPEAATSPSVVSFLTGRLPMEHGVRLLYQLVPDDLVSVPMRLAQKGYQTAGVVSNIVLTAEAIGLDRHFHYYDDFVSEKVVTKDVFERSAGKTTDAAIRWLVQKRKSSKPHFLWVHYMDPHGPYTPPETKPIDFDHDTPQEVDINLIPTYQRLGDETNARDYIDRYDEEIAYTDFEIGRLLDAYRSMGLADDALIIFTADHGESMMEHEKWFTHSYQVYEELIHVPLAMTGPGVPQARVSEPVCNKDIAPTVLYAAGLDLPAEEAARVLDSTPELQEILVESTQLRHTHWRALIRGKEKRVVSLHHKNQKVLEKRRYDLEEDSGELTALPWEENDPLGERLIEVIEQDKGLGHRERNGVRLNAPKVARDDLDEETLDKLRALGYVDDQ